MVSRWDASEPGRHSTASVRFDHRPDGHFMRAADIGGAVQLVPVYDVCDLKYLLWALRRLSGGGTSE